MRCHNEGQDDGFSLVELLVVVIILGVLAAIAIPQFLNQRQSSRDAAAISDIRNLATVVTTIASEEGVNAATVNETTVAERGWEPSGAAVRACAAFPSSDNVTLTVWNTLGSVVYSWTLATAAVQGTPQPTQPADCGAAAAGTTLID